MILPVAIFLSTAYYVCGGGAEKIVVLKTNYVEVKVDTTLGAITSLSADFFGRQNFTQNVLSTPILLEPIKAKDGTPMAWSERAVSSVKTNGQSKLNFVVESYLTDSSTPTTQESWSISINGESRKIEAKVEGKLLQSTSDIQALAYGVYSPNPSLYAFTSEGVLQMMSKPHACLGLGADLERYYTLGAGSALEVVATLLPSSSNPPAFSSNHVLISSTSQQASGLQTVVLGKYPRVSRHLRTAWSSLCWEGGEAMDIGEASWSLSFSLLPNNYNFPTYLLQDVKSTGFTGWSEKDVATYLMGPYVSGVGCLQSYYTHQKGIIAPTVSHPEVGYDPDTNFFDPDNFMTLSAMLYTNDVYLYNEVKEVLRRTASTMCGLGTDADRSYCEQPRQRFLTSLLRANTDKSRYGQLMHHFISLRPTYESIAGSEQLGPNIFWTLTMLRYIGVTQDTTFADEMLPYIKLSVQFVLSFVDKLEGEKVKTEAEEEKGAEGDMYIVNAPGPLWIDVLVREYYASDSNTMMVDFLREVGEYMLSIGEMSLAMQLLDISQGIAKATNFLLWNGMDHYITQYNPADKTSRDFVDYDSNLMAVAFGLLSPPDALKVLQRIDNNNISHARATWCSEVPYTSNTSDCYQEGGEYCADSIVTLARIGYVDAWARKRVGQGEFIRDVILDPLQDDELASVWMYERYDVHGQVTHNPFYFEYPALITMVLREIVYGINMKSDGLTIDPMDSQVSYAYSLGNIHVQYSKEEVGVKITSALTSTHSEKTTSRMIKVEITGLYANTAYSVCREGGEVIMRVQSSAEGVVNVHVKGEALSAGLHVKLIR